MAGCCLRYYTFPSDLQACATQRAPQFSKILCNLSFSQILNLRPVILSGDPDQGINLINSVADPDPLVRGMDPDPSIIKQTDSDPHQNVMDPQHCNKKWVQYNNDSPVS
jgi:hypothetical protein